MGAVLNALNYRSMRPPSRYACSTARRKSHHRPRARADRGAGAEESARDLRGRHRRRRWPRRRAPRRDRLRVVARRGRSGFELRGPDEWDSLALLYTSGTTGVQGLAYHHRASYLNALGTRSASGSTAALGVPVDAADVSCSGWTTPGRDRRSRHARVPAPGRFRRSIFPAIERHSRDAPVRRAMGVVQHAGARAEGAEAPNSIIA